MTERAPERPRGGLAGRTLRKTFVSLRNRNFRLYFIGQLISNTGNWLQTVALTLFVLKLTRSGLAVGVITACQWGPTLFLSAWAGAITDRTDKRRMLLITQTLEIAPSIGFAILAFAPHPPIAALYALALGMGILIAFDSPARRSFVPEMVRQEDLSNGVVLYSMTQNVSRIFGPALAGVLVVTAGYGWCFTLDAISFLAVLVCLLMMRPSELHRRAPKPREKGEVRAGLAYVWSMPTMWISFVMLVIVGTLAYNFSVTLPLLVKDALHVPVNSGFTLLYSVFSAGAVIGGLVVAHRELVRIEHVILGALSIGLVLVGLAFVPTLLAAVPVVLLLGAASVLYMTSSTSIVQVEAAREMHGRVLSLQNVIIGGAALIGGPLLGWIADSMGGRAPVMFGGIAALAAAGFGYFAARRYSSHPTPD